MSKTSKQTRLVAAWKKQVKLRAEGDLLWAEGSRLNAEGDLLWAEAAKLRAEGDKLRAEGAKLWAESYKLWAEGAKLWAESYKLWAEAVLAAYGNVEIDWSKSPDCIVEGVTYKANKAAKKAKP